VLCVVCCVLCVVCCVLCVVCVPRHSRRQTVQVREDHDPILPEVYHHGAGHEPQENQTLTFNDNSSTISHIVSDNRHKNMRLSVIWGALRESYTKNVFGLRFMCGKTLDICDVTKFKSG